ncbi:MAG: glycoside hydrolase family 28 protein, partial [Spirochaetota bacterium]|nr:glycoside hydrolase family 28 protein [Spirochaetota bacterium]
MRQYTLRSFGAVGDGLNNDSEAFVKAFGALSEGGVLHLEEGTYLTGPLHIRAKNLVIELDKGAVIKFIADETLYRPVYSRWEGVNCYCMHPCVLIEEADGLIVRGEGVLDGNGGWWWEAANLKRNSQKG